MTGSIIEPKSQVRLTLGLGLVLSVGAAVAAVGVRSGEEVLVKETVLGVRVGSVKALAQVVRTVVVK